MRLRVGSGDVGDGYPAGRKVRCSLPRQVWWSSYVSRRGQLAAHAGVENGLIERMDRSSARPWSYGHRADGRTRSIAPEQVRWSSCMSRRVYGRLVLELRTGWLDVWITCLRGGIGIVVSSLRSEGRL